MSRSGYTDDGENVGLWRGAVDRAMGGYRGQYFLRKLRDALDAMPTKRLITDEIANGAGDVCALGAVDPACKADPDDREAVGQHFGIAPAMAAEIVYINDERFDGEYVTAEGPSRFLYHGRPRDVWRPFTPEERWALMRAWVEKQIVPADDGASNGH